MPLVQKALPLRDQVMDAVLELLQKGEIPPGARVTELELAKTLNVSRTPIREALGRLAQQGILDHPSTGGYYVPLPTVAELHDIIEVRMLLEPVAAGMAAREFTETDVKRMRKAIDAQTKHLKSEASADFAKANQRFRAAIFDQVRNLVLRATIKQFDSHLQFIRVTTLNNLDLRKDIVKRQTHICDAIAKGDDKTSEELWRGYLELTEQSLVAALREWRS